MIAGHERPRRGFRLYARVAAVVVVAMLAGFFAGFRLDLAPLAVYEREITFGAASARFIVDGRASPTTEASIQAQPFASRAEILTDFLVNGGTRKAVARALDLPPSRLGIEGLTEPLLPASQSDAPYTERVVEISERSKPFRVTYAAVPGSPVVRVSTIAPTRSQALELARAALAQADRMVTTGSDNLPPRNELVLRQVAATQARTVNPNGSLIAAIVVGFATMAIALALLRRLAYLPSRSSKLVGTQS